MPDFPVFGEIQHPFALVVNAPSIADVTAARVATALNEPPEHVVEMFVAQALQLDSEGSSKLP